MKKSLIIALALVAGASLSTVDAKKKKVVVKEEAPVVEAFKLATSSDTISYMAGMSSTVGLVNFLLQQKVDTAYMADFVCGFNETVSKNLDDPKQKAYMMGTQIAQQLVDRMLPGVKKELEGSADSLVSSVFFKGFTDALMLDTTFFKVNDAEKQFKAKMAAVQADKEERLYGPNRDAGRKFLSENAKKDGVITLPSGLQYKVLTQGTGAVPTTSDKVKVHYEGRLIDGTVFDASKKHGDEPAEFRPTDVIKGWTEALTMMPVGSKWQVYIPFELAYGNRDAGQIKPYSALIFDIELVGIVDNKPAASETGKAKKPTSGKNVKTKKITKK
jgi:FKBP-type peptidyl-prolyl cis-trans isomerase FklB